ncbi:hypothetical protein GDO81_021464 [Engystomops pustulosus]|uniref:protein-ribulosamine 3-kinase n=1 Tax=Engystomops pustulosus TaxID=76066 RepID=A0AAV6Z9K9_ENGPU|nr:hypothetical protein GDO81_021464 [Engystomops pustulosus]
MMDIIDGYLFFRFARSLGEQLGDLHAYNGLMQSKMQKTAGIIGKYPESPGAVENFGFHTTTCCGYIPQLKVPNAFRDTTIVPALLHGDLWEANVGEDDRGPILFDPGSFYGHSEYELSIGDMFGDRCGDFYEAYHRKIPKSPGFELRQPLYQLFHSLNNWNHFGSAFRRSTLDLMRYLLQIL